MNGAEVLAVLKSIGVTQAEFARVISVTPRNVNRWVHDKLAVPAPIVIILVLIREKKVTWNDICTSASGGEIRVSALQGVP